MSKEHPTRRDLMKPVQLLGLALVAQHVARHRGRVWVEDRPGGGSRFVVELPGIAS